MAIVGMPRTNQATLVARRKSVAGKAAFLALVTLGAFIQLVPFIWALLGAFKSRQDVLAYPVKWLPFMDFRPTVSNFVEVFQKVPLARYFLNSITVAAAILVLNVILCPLAGFALAKYKFRGRDLIFMFILSTIMIPFEVTVVPLYVIAQRLGWLDTYAGLIIPVGIEVFAVYLARQFIMGIPDELVEAARMDGCSEVGIFTRVIMPLCRPLLLAISILVFTTNWNAFFWPLIVTSSGLMSTLPLGLSRLVMTYEVPYNLLMAGSVLATLPTVFLYLYLQEYFIKGMVLSGLKG